MSLLRVNERISIKACRTSSQKCIRCGEFLSKGTIAISCNNTGDKLILRKNLWLHIECGMKFSILIKKFYRKNKAEIIAMGV